MTYDQSQGCIRVNIRSDGRLGCGCRCVDSHHLIQHTHRQLAHNTDNITDCTA